MRFLVMVLLAVVMGCGDDPAAAEAAEAAAAFIDSAAAGNLEVVKLFVAAGMWVEGRSYGGGVGLLYALAGAVLSDGFGAAGDGP